MDFKKFKKWEMRAPWGATQGHQNLKNLQNWPKLWFLLFCFKTNHFEVMFPILQHWADVIIYNSYMKQIKYLQGLNLGALEKTKIVILGVWLLFSCITFDWIEHDCLKWPMPTPNFFNSMWFLAKIKSPLRVLFEKSEKFKVSSLILHKEFCRLAWLNFWQHIVNPDKIFIHLIGCNIGF